MSTPLASTIDNNPLSIPKSESVGTAPLPPAEVAILQSIAESEVQGLITGYIEASISKNTRRAYSADLRAFRAAGLDLPCSVAALLSYLVRQSSTLSVRTLRRRLIALRRFHEAVGASDPTRSDAVNACMDGISRIHGRPARGASPLLAEDVVRAIALIDDSLIGKRDAALISLGFAGGFRRGELSNLSVVDIVEHPRGMVVTVCRSKTDQHGTGRQVGIPWGNTAACPVRAWKEWIQAAELATGSLFRSITKGGTVGGSLTPQSVNLIVKRRFTAIGRLPSETSAHGLRSGLVTSAAMRGVPSAKIREQTGHRSDAMVGRYIRKAELFLNNAAAGLL